MFVDDDRLRRLQGLTRSAEPETRRESPGLPDAIGRYRVRALLGRGGMGVVYRAFDADLQREVAVKVLSAADRHDEERIARFWREARIAGSLTHPGIVAVHEVGEVEGSPFVVMEAIDGEPLAKVIEERDPWPLRDRVALVRDAARAVQHAHEHGIVHRDLKPSNLLVDRAGRARVLDFGLARRMDAQSRLTASDQVLGTPGYMAPEQIVPERGPIAAATDVFALGAILYEVLTRRRAVPGESAAEIMHATLHGPVLSPVRVDPQISRDLETICLRCLEPTPAGRYADARALADDLERWLTGETIHARPAPARVRLMRAALRHQRTLLPLAGLVLLAAAGAGWTAWNHARRAAALAQQEGEAARAETARAQAALEKARRVADVLGRWSALATPLRELEAVYYDSRLAGEARRVAAERAWEPFRRFLEETPAAPAARSVARAFGGWARRLAGHEEEGLAWMREAATLDPELPFGASLEALVLLGRYLEAQDLPSTYSSGAGIRVLGKPQETPAMAGLREQAEERLAAAAAARVWGGGIAAELQAIVRAMRTLQAGDYDQADRELTGLLGGAPWFRTDLLLARAHARTLAGRHETAVEDYLEVHAARPGHAPSCRLVALAVLKAGFVEDLRSRDARPRFRSALAYLEKALELDPTLSAARSHRAMILRDLGLAEARHGGSPEAAFTRAIADYAADAEEWPEEPGPRAGLAITQDAFGDWYWETGRDAREAYRRAAEQLEEAARRGFAERDLLAGRGGITTGRALAEAAAGADPEPLFAAALESYTDLLKKWPDDVETWQLRGKTRYYLGDHRERQGRDPMDVLESAVADLSEAIRRQPSFTAAWEDRANARIRLGESELARGRDPRPYYRLALADCEEAIRLRPDDPVPQHNRGAAWLRIAEAELASGGEVVPAVQEAVAGYGEALRLSPQRTGSRAHRGDAYALWGHKLLQGRRDPWEPWERAIADYRAARAEKTMAWNSLFCFGQILEAQAAYGEAAEVYEEALRARDARDEPGVRARLEQVRAAIAASGPGPLPGWVLLAHRGGEEVGRGRIESARSLLEKALAEAGPARADESPDGKAARLRAVYNLACAYARSAEAPAGSPSPEPGFHDRAFARLDEAIGLGWTDADHLERDPDLESLRSDPRWAALVRRCRR